MTETETIAAPTWASGAVQPDTSGALPFACTEYQRCPADATHFVYSPGNRGEWGGRASCDEHLPDMPALPGADVPRTYPDGAQ